VSQTGSITVADLRSRIDRERLIARLQKLVRTESENPPGNEYEVAHSVAATCKDLGLDVSLHQGEPNRPCVVARWV
jgi:acetylornithine deacetylase/succinyl-diaminopimelate desuccinylase-like protein